MATNLPARSIEDSALQTKIFFDTYGIQPLEFNAVEVDATLAFFTKRGFKEDSAQSITLSLLKQAKLEAINVFSILDNLSTLNDLQISALVSEILNNNRPSTSTLGYRQTIDTVSKQRNVIA